MTLIGGLFVGNISVLTPIKKALLLRRAFFMLASA